MNSQDELTDQEKEDVEEILKALTADEIACFPDDHMPLRHLRAEKVRETLVEKPWHRCTAASC